MQRVTNLLAQTVAAVAIALFWCISAVGTTVGTTVGITTLATAINAATSTPVEAGRRWRGRGRRWLGDVGVGGAVAGTATLTATATPTTLGPITVQASTCGSASKDRTYSKGVLVSQMRSVGKRIAGNSVGDSAYGLDMAPVNPTLLRSRGVGHLHPAAFPAFNAELDTFRNHTHDCC